MSLEILLEPIPDRASVVRLCKVGKFHIDLPEQYQVALQQLITLSYQDGGLTDEELTDRLRKAGCDVGSTVVRKHRKQQCACTA